DGCLPADRVGQHPSELVDVPGDEGLSLDELDHSAGEGGLGKVEERGDARQGERASMLLGGRPAPRTHGWCPSKWQSTARPSHGPHPGSLSSARLRTDRCTWSEVVKSSTWVVSTTTRPRTANKVLHPGSSAVKARAGSSLRSASAQR